MASVPKTPEKKGEICFGCDTEPLFMGPGRFLYFTLLYPVGIQQLECVCVCIKSPFALEHTLMVKETFISFLLFFIFLFLFVLHRARVSF